MVSKGDKTCKLLQEMIKVMILQLQQTIFNLIYLTMAKLWQLNTWEPSNNHQLFCTYKQLEQSVQEKKITLVESKPTHEKNSQRQSNASQ